MVCGDIDADDAAVLEEQREGGAPVQGMTTDLSEIALAGDADQMLPVSNREGRDLFSPWFLASSEPRFRRLPGDLTLDSESEPVMSKVSLVILDLLAARTSWMSRQRCHQRGHLRGLLRAVCTLLIEVLQGTIGETATHIREMAAQMLALSVRRDVADQARRPGTAPWQMAGDIGPDAALLHSPAEVFFLSSPVEYADGVRNQSRMHGDAIAHRQPGAGRWP